MMCWERIVRIKCVSRPHLDQAEAIQLRRWPVGRREEEIRVSVAANVGPTMENVVLRPESEDDTTTIEISGPENPYPKLPSHAPIWKHAYSKNGTKTEEGTDIPTGR